MHGSQLFRLQQLKCLKNDADLSMLKDKQRVKDKQHELAREVKPLVGAHEVFEVFNSPALPEIGFEFLAQRRILAYYFK
jgi:hypothetical protein